MRELAIRQPRRRLMLVLGLAYLVAILVPALINFDLLAGIVNELAAGGAKSTGMIVGVIVFIPLIVLLLLARERVLLRRDAATLTVRIRRDERIIRDGEIAGYTVNEPTSTGSLRLLGDDGRVLLELHPRIQDFRQAQELAIPAAAFVEVDRRSVFRGRAQAVTYRRESVTSRR
ncbi:hypothetical protein [Microbacterium tumbae]